MYRWYVEGPFVSPKGSTLHLKDPYRVRNVVKSSESGWIRIRWKACRISNLVKILALVIWPRISSIRGRGYWSVIVIVLSLRKSMQKRREPLGFLTNSTGAAKAAFEGTIKPLAKFSSR